MVGAEGGAGHLQVGVSGARHKPEPMYNVTRENVINISNFVEIHCLRIWKKIFLMKTYTKSRVPR